MATTVSIITVCRNAQDTIEETINSVLSQTYPNIEYIVIDGNSTDNTVSVVEKYKKRLACFISEPDNGMYDAMNKGIKVAKGDILYFLNTDDVLYHPSAISNIVKHFSEDNFDFLYCDILMFDKDTGQCHIKKHNRVNKTFLYTNAIPQQAVLYRRRAFEKCGNFSTEYKIVSDRDWLLKAFLRHKLKSKYVGIPVALFTQGGLSNNEKYENLHAQERQRMKKAYFNNFLVSFTANFMPKSLKYGLMKLIKIFNAVLNKY